MDVQIESASVRYVMPLSTVTRADISRVGAKAANLGELAQAGFPVPEGFALTTQAFDQFIKLNELDEAQLPEKVLKAEIPLDVEAALRTASEKLDGALLAVRSSGVAEDLADASFAGQYETILGVAGYDALVEAVRQCWASAFSGRVSTYKSNKGQASNASMAVLVQRLVDADAAGVAFTANPVNGQRDETVVSAVRGLGERLVSGEASPDEWVVNGSDAIRTSAPEKAIDESQAHAIADMARRAEGHFGAPQDVEWAIADGKLFMLQARPITALPEPGVTPIPVPANPPPGFWERESTHIPEPLSPMMASAVVPAQQDATYAMFKEFALPIEGIQYRQIGGWPYQRMVPPGDKDVPPPPSWLMPILIRVVPQMRRMVKGMVETVRGDKAGKTVERWYDEWKPDTIARLGELGKVDSKAHLIIGPGWRCT